MKASMRQTITAGEIARRLGARPSGSGWIARCPAHDDRNPSLSISAGEDGRLLLYCHAGCSYEDIRSRLGLDQEDRPVRPSLVKSFEYRDSDGGLKYIKERWEPGFDGGRKSFVFKRPDGRKGRGFEPILYKLPALAGADTVFITEGEAKADLLNSWGLIATCLDSGAGSPWRDSYTKALRGKDVFILPDNDEAGRGYAKRLVQALSGKAKRLRVVQLPGLPEKGDIIDWARRAVMERNSFLSSSRLLLRRNPLKKRASLPSAQRHLSGYGSKPCPIRSTTSLTSSS